MARAHTVAFTSRFCTTYLTFDSRKEARAACDKHYATKFFTLCAIGATYVGRRIVKRHKRHKAAVRPPLTLEAVPVVALFDNNFPCHLEVARIDSGYVGQVDKREHRRPILRCRIHRVSLPKRIHESPDEGGES